MEKFCRHVKFCPSRCELVAKVPRTLVSRTHGVHQVPVPWGPKKKGKADGFTLLDENTHNTAQRGECPSMRWLI